MNTTTTPPEERETINPLRVNLFEKAREAGEETAPLAADHDASDRLKLAMEPEEEREPEPEPLRPLREDWCVEFWDENGRRRKCDVVSTVPSIDDKINIAKRVARLASPVSVQALPYEGQVLLKMFARVSVQLSGMSSALERVLAHHESQLVDLFERCAEHETAFFRSNYGSRTGLQDRGLVVKVLPSKTSPL